jgi:hypothetical protein
MGENQNTFLSRQERDKCFDIPSPVQYKAGIPSQRNKAKERNKRDSNRKGSSQFFHICR